MKITKVRSKTLDELYVITDSMIHVELMRDINLPQTTGSVAVQVETLNKNRGNDNSPNHYNKETDKKVTGPHN